MTSQAERASHAWANAEQVQLLREALLAAQSEPDPASPLKTTGHEGCEVPCPSPERLDPQADTP